MKTLNNSSIKNVAGGLAYIRREWAEYEELMRDYASLLIAK